MSDHPDFDRLATGLRAAIIDFDYYRTRKLLEPNWDGYDMPKDHDFVNTDVDLVDANLLTSQHRDDPDMHRVVLDLDYGVTRQRSFLLDCHRLILSRSPDTTNHVVPATRYLVAALHSEHLRAAPGRNCLQLDVLCDFALIPSTTENHFHLILDVNMPWPKYARLLHLFTDAGIIELGYAKASQKRGFSAIRPPWIRKDTPASVNTQTTPTRLTVGSGPDGGRNNWIAGPPHPLDRRGSPPVAGAARNQQPPLGDADGRHTQRC